MQCNAIPSYTIDCAIHSPYRRIDTILIDSKSQCFCCKHDWNIITATLKKDLIKVVFQASWWYSELHSIKCSEYLPKIVTMMIDKLRIECVLQNMSRFELAFYSILKENSIPSLWASFSYAFLAQIPIPACLRQNTIVLYIIVSLSSIIVRWITKKIKFLPRSSILNHVMKFETSFLIFFRSARFTFIFINLWFAKTHLAYAHSGLRR